MLKSEKQRNVEIETNSNFLNDDESSDDVQFIEETRADNISEANSQTRVTIKLTWIDPITFQERQSSASKVRLRKKLNKILEAWEKMPGVKNAFSEEQIRRVSFKINNVDIGNFRNDQVKNVLNECGISDITKEIFIKVMWERVVKINCPEADFEVQFRVNIQESLQQIIKIWCRRSRNEYSIVNSFVMGEDPFDKSELRKKQTLLHYLRQFGDDALKIQIGLYADGGGFGKKGKRFFPY